MKILGIETSCDETSAAVVEDGKKVLSNIIASSADLHAITGGVVPEVAAREHLLQISPVVDKALEEARVTWKDIEAIAVTNAPGLMPALLIGVNSAQAMAYIHKIPLIPTHHIAGHIYSTQLDREKDRQFPALILTVSGGHNEIYLMKSHWEFEKLGETLDDAAGEAFDKVARLLGMGYPGGPAISKAAEKGDATRFDFPRVMLGKDNPYNFSFSGLKSAVRRVVEDLESVNDQDKNDLAASFQMAVIEVLAKKLTNAAMQHNIKEVHLVGGFSANTKLREEIKKNLLPGTPFFTPKTIPYCTDNAAMIASAGYFLVQKNPKATCNGKKVEVFSNKPL